VRRETVRRKTVRRKTVRRGTARSALAVTATAATAGMAAVSPVTVAAARAPGADLSAFVAAIAVGLGWLVVVRLVVATLAVLVAALPGVAGTTARRIAGAVSPRFARSAVRIACGVAVAGTPLAGAGAAMAEPPDPGSGARAALTSAVRIVQPTVPVLDRQVVTPPGLPTTATAPRAPRAASDPPPRRVVVVRSGDSLWSIAARELGPHATDAEVAKAWPRWYHANADVIGPDAALIRPGQHLQVPDDPTPRTRAAS
jgi:nucleoid-associated protein YgaU